MRTWLDAFVLVLTVLIWEIPRECSGDDAAAAATPAPPSQMDLLKKSFATKGGPECADMYKTDKFPFVATVLYRNSGRLLCMGSLVDHYHILTARKCYEKCDHTDLLVVLGYYKPYWGQNSQVLRVIKIVRNAHGIALLRLKDPARYTKYVAPTRLPMSFSRLWFEFDLTWKSPFVQIGYPVDRFDAPGELISRDKVYTGLERSYSACGGYPRISPDPRRDFCTTGNGTYCWGGWGGPVMKWMPTEYFLQIGVMINDNCTSEVTSPFLCARTDVFGDWIRGNTWHGQQPT